MEKLSLDEIFNYFGVLEEFELVWPSISLDIFRSVYAKFYKPRTSKKQFFNDRPWIRRDPSLYEDYIREDFRLKNEEIRRKKKEYSQIPNGEIRKLFYIKKTS